MLRITLALGSIAALFVACSATNGNGTTGDNGTGGSGATSNASATASIAASSSAGGAIPNGCNAVMNDAPEIQPADVVESAPMPMGGVIADGTYFLTALTHYAQAKAGPDGMKQKTKLVVNGKNWQVVSTPMGQGDYQSSEVIDPSGVELGDQRTCPDSGVLLLDQYTATATEIIVYQIFTGVPLIAQSFAKQP